MKRSGRILRGRMGRGGGVQQACQYPRTTPCALQEHAAPPFLGGAGFLPTHHCYTPCVDRILELSVTWQKAPKDLVSMKLTLALLSTPQTPPCPHHLPAWRNPTPAAAVRTSSSYLSPPTQNPNSRTFSEENMKRQDFLIWIFYSQLSQSQNQPYNTKEHVSERDGEKRTNEESHRSFSMQVHALEVLTGPTGA